MARGRFGRTRTRTVYRNLKSRARRPRKNDLKKYGKKLAIGAAAGLIVSVPLTLAARYFGQPTLMEAGQRIGGIVAATQGPVGEAGYQAVDAAFDRFIALNGRGITGTNQMVYL